MLLIDIFSLCLRIGELAFSAVVAGLTGQYLHEHKGASAWDEKRFIYTEVIAAIAILYALLFLLPFMSTFWHWPMDFLLFAGLLIAFALLAHYDNSCGSIWNWNGIAGGNYCDKFRADLAFLFLASIFFLVSALLGLWVIHRHTRTTRVEKTRTTRRRWYNSRY
ncbi:hypothetical protein L207DRAFT_509348 [Hyaloscypha variabilis F]|uniref:MARVEL domain-containing protein n=1 Tax=Hyaloscypha variabilis (strain UAMH 11265 / GT02V1 / F) TaxID=1149755 RepID=A0A2J6S1J6_HYAVF|nr:hypothetical protein L207DRAFT_509348 [Hyaloscypha variabilis F]